MQIKYLDAYDVLLNQDYILKLTNESNFLYSLEFALGAFIGMAITYLMFPFIFKNGQTLGKKAFGLGLANSDGYILNNNQLFMRIMPLFVCNAALLIPMWPNLLVMMLVYLTVFLVSFALAMASPKKASLHDFSARTIVINLKTSTLFKDEFEEEAYLLKEDDITPELSEGEEPELKYEK